MPGKSLFGDWKPHPKHLTESEVIGHLKPYMPIVKECWHGGMVDFKGEITERGRGRLSPISRGANVNDFAVAIAKELFASHPEVRFCEELGFAKWYFPGGIVGRFKKLDWDRLAIGIKSPQAKKYYANAALAGIDNDAMRITFGYLAHKVTKDIEEVCVTFQWSPNNLAWFHRIDDTDGGIYQLPKPLAPLAPPPITLTPLIAVKRPAERG